MSEPLYKLDVDGERVLMTDAEVAAMVASRAAGDTPSVPRAISDRQFAHGLWKRDVISFAEALAFVKVGELPATLASIVAGLPPGTRDDVALLLCGATEFERAHASVPAIATAFGWDVAATDDFWRFAATL